MDGERFDAIVRAITVTRSRRGALRLLAGGALGGALAGHGAEGATAACVPAGRRCGGGARCCADATCRGGECRCKPGVVACFAGEWGRDGRGPGEFGWLVSPLGMAVGPGGRVYAADPPNHRIQKFDADGRFLAAWGGRGRGYGQFDRPYGVAVDGDGNVFVADSWNDRVQKFAPDGTFLAAWGRRGLGDGEFLDPTGIAVDRQGNVYVVDTDVDPMRVQKFDGRGRHLATWGEGFHEVGSPWERYLAVDAADNVYVTDAYDRLVRKFDRRGNPLTEWRLSEPNGVAVDGAGHVYVTNVSTQHRVHKFDGDGTPLGGWGRGYGGEPGQFWYPAGLAFGDDGRVFVADSGNNRVQKFLLA